MNDSYNKNYIPLSDDETKNLFEDHKLIINSFIEGNHQIADLIKIDESALYSLITKVEQRRQYFKYFHGLNMSEYKEIGLVSFWYIKYHPIYIDETIQKAKAIPNASIEFINEKIAVYYILVTLRKMATVCNIKKDALDVITDKYVKDLIYSFSHRDISKESMILIIETMAVFLGLNPYKDDDK